MEEKAVKKRTVKKAVKKLEPREDVKARLEAVYAEMKAFPAKEDKLARKNVGIALSLLK